MDSNFQLDNEGWGLDAPLLGSSIDSFGYPCDNCGANKWNLRESRGDLVCGGCGACDGGVSKLGADRAAYDDAEGLGVGPVEQSQLHVETVLAEMPSRKMARNYDRGYYFRRRVKQWFIQDSNIPEEDWKIIEQAFDTYARGVIKAETFLRPSNDMLRQSRGYRIPGTILLDKADVRLILHDCEPLRRDTLAWRWESAEQKKPTFVKRYFKHWLQIRWRFSGLVSSAEKNSSRLLEKLDTAVKELHQAFPHVRDLNEIAKRKSFPPINMVMRRLFVYLQMNDVDDEEFDLLKTRKGRRKFEFLWWEFCKYLQWPYLSKEAFFLTRKQRSKNGRGKK